MKKILLDLIKQGKKGGVEVFEQQQTQKELQQMDYIKK